MPSGRAAIVDRRHEIADVSGRSILWTAAALATMIVLVALAAWGVVSLLGESLAPNISSRQAAVSRMATPRLQRDPARDLAALREEKHAMLNSYRWLDRQAGVVQIPIERAMALMVERSRASPPAGKPTEPAQ